MGRVADDDSMERLVSRRLGVVCHASGVTWEERAGSPVGGGIGALEISDVHPVERFVRLSITYLSGTCGAAAQVSWIDVDRVAAELRGGARSAVAVADVAIIARTPSAPGGKVSLQDLDVGGGEVSVELAEIASRDAVCLRISLDGCVVSMEVARECVAPAIAATLRAVDAVSS